MTADIKKFYRGKKVLITGGTGFIGSHLVKQLVEFGAQVFVLRKPKANFWRINQVIKKVKIINLNLKNLPKLRKFIVANQPEIIFNLAAHLDTRQIAQTLPKLLRENFITTLNLLRAVTEKVRPEKFVQFGTMEEYGRQKAPFLETQREMPVSPYSLTKTMASQLALSFHRLTGLDVCVVRPAAVFGSKQGLGTLIPNFIISCLSKKNFNINPGNQLRDFIYIEDLVEGILAAGFKKESSGEIINMGSGSFYKIGDVVNKINQFLGFPITINFGANPYRPLDNPKSYMDSSKAKKILNWRASRKFDIALLKTIKWYDDNRDLISKIYGKK